MNRRTAIRRLLAAPFAAAAALPVFRQLSRPTSAAIAELPMTLDEPLDVTFGDIAVASDKASGEALDAWQQFDRDLQLEAARGIAATTERALLEGHEVVVVEGGNGFGEFRVYGFTEEHAMRLELVQIVAPGEQVVVQVPDGYMLRAWSNDEGLDYELLPPAPFDPVEAILEFDRAARAKDWPR